MRLSSRFPLALSFLLLPVAAVAQQQPDAGRTIQEQRQAPSLPALSPSIPVVTPRGDATQPGGARIAIERIVIEGNMRFSDAQLQEVVADAVGTRLDMAGIKG